MCPLHVTNSAEINVYKNYRHLNEREVLKFVLHVIS